MSNLELPALDGVLGRLAEYVAIPSNSRDADPGTMRRAADWIAGQLDFAGGRVEETGGHPVVRGEWLGAPGAPTVLVYGHYDVQPTGDEAEWLSPPFQLTVDGDIARGRGVSDDKGPVLLVVEMLRAAIAQRGATAAEREVPHRGRRGDRQPAPARVRAPAHHASSPATW